MAQQHDKLVPIAVAHLAPHDLKEFIDISYEDLSDFREQERHFGWSQTLRAIATKMEGWADKNPNSSDVHLTFERAGRVKAASASARPVSGTNSTIGQVGLAAVWEKINREDPTDLLHFAENYRGTPEALEARRLADALIRRQDAEFEKVNWDDAASINRFLLEWPNHSRASEARQRLQSLPERLRQKGLEERKAIAFERKQANYEDQMSRYYSACERNIKVVGWWAFGMWLFWLYSTTFGREGFSWDTMWSNVFSGGFFSGLLMLGVLVLSLGLTAAMTIGGPIALTEKAHDNKLWLLAIAGIVIVAAIGSSTDSLNSAGPSIVLAYIGAFIGGLVFEPKAPAEPA